MIIGRNLPSDGNIAFAVYSVPSLEPVTVDELKEFARIDGNEEDTILASFISSVRIATEEYLGRALITQTIRATLDFWPEKSGQILLPRPPLQSVNRIFIRAEDGTETEFSSDNYYIVTEDVPGYIQLRRDSSSFPSVNRDRAGLCIDYIAGYGDNRENVPEQIRTAILFWATLIYENRVPIADPPAEAKTLLNLFRVERLL